MKIIIPSSSDRGLEAEIDSKFGRAAYFALIDSDDMSIEFIKNESANQASGAGVGAAQLCADSGADIIIANDFGPKAFYALDAADIEMYSISSQDSLNSAIESLKNGKLTKVTAPTSRGRK